MKKKKDIKGRPQKHKDRNTFLFKSFNQRISDISVDLRTQLLGSSWKPTSDESFFYEAYNKWADLNRTQHFSDFQRDVRGKIQSYPLVVFHKDAIVECLNQHLAVEESLAFEPLLDLVVNLAKDLQEDFFQYFPRLFQTFLDNLFPSQDAEILEWTFSCLSQLFRIQRRPMMRNLESIFKLMTPLFEEDRKDFVVRFATESFAFLIRDFRDYSGIIEFLLSYCILRPDLAVGIGELLFETVKNVNRHLHSVFEKIFPVLLDKLRDEKFDREEIDNCIINMTSFLRNHLSHDTANMFWDVLLKSVEDRQQGICRQHCLIFLKFVELKEGILITNPARTMTVFSSYILSGSDGINDSTSNLLAEAASALIRYNHFQYDMKLASRMTLIRNVFSSGLTVDAKFLFAQSLLNLPQYQTEVLPSLLAFCSKEYKNNLERVLVSLISVILHNDPHYSTSTSSTELFQIDFGTKNAIDVNAFFASIITTADDAGTDKWSYLWAFAILAPHIRPLSTDLSDRISTFLDSAVLILQRENLETCFRRIICQAIHSFVLAISILNPNSSETITGHLAPLLRSCHNDVSFLSALEASISTNETLPADIMEVLMINLRHSSHALRRTTLRILDKCTSSGEKSVYDICLHAEMVEPSVQDYREKLRYLRMLDYGQLDKLGCDASVPLLYLFGCLKIGFQPVWKEIKQLIATYRPTFSTESVWSLFETELRLVSAEAEVEELTSVADEYSGNGLFALMDSQHEFMSRSDSNPLNAHKYRNHLWETFSEVIGVDTARNRIFSELFQRFMRNEFLPATLLNSSNEIEEQSPQTDRQRSSRKSRAEAEETVCSMLELLTKLHNPMALHQDPLVRGFLFDLLTYRTAKVQSVALRLLFNYKLEYIRPYEEHLMKLLEETDMWNTLAEIEFGASNPVIKEEHRSLLVPLIIRILFGRMQTKNKSRNTEKAAPRGRKEAIVRTLANCRPEEFMIFLNLTLKPCSALIEGSIEETVGNIVKGFRLPNVHLKLADGVLQTLFVIVDELRSGADHCIHILFRSIVGILAIVVAKRRGNVSMMDESNDETGGSGLLKKLRKECYKCLAKMSTVFPANTFTETERKVLMDVSVWPEVDNVIRDGPFTVTPLMRLILSWSQHASYHNLLAITSSDNNHSPLGIVIMVLNPDVGANASSIKLAIDVLDNLLNPEVLEEEKGQKSAVEFYWTLDQRKKVLTPYAGTVLKYLQHKLTVFLARKKRKTSPLTDCELRIASGISELSLDADQSNALMCLLLSLLESCEMKKESDLLGLLEIVHKLVGSVSSANLTEKVCTIASLLSKNFTRDSRTLLSRILSDISYQVGTANLKAIASTACDLLSWDTKHIDNMDYERRSNAYHEAKLKIIQNVNGEKADVNYALLVLHIADYDIRKAIIIESSVLREHGLICTLAIIRRFSTTTHSSLILSHLTPLVKDGLKDREEKVRNAFIAILGEIVDFYPTHALFRDLVFLHNPGNKRAQNSDKCRYCNSDGLLIDISSNQQTINDPIERCRCYNPDLDIFENLRHIQKHRVGGAFHEISRWCMDKSIPVSTMMQYFLPLATAYLCNDQYLAEKFQGLINAVIELVGAVCSQLPWVKYEPMLKHFLNMMARKPIYQRQLIRVVVAIMDAFHFDLSGVDFRTFHLQKKTAMKEKNPEPAMGEMVDEEGLDEPNEQAVENVVGGNNQPTASAKAAKIYRSLSEFIIPGLSKLITDKGENDISHKLTADLHANEKEEILRAPVALAIVKLLQKLPVPVLRRQISGVFLKIARMLKSRLLSVRESTRETLAEIMMSLGPSYLATLIKEMKGVLKRGYQIHVLVHCVHMILTKLQPTLKSGDLDRCVGELVEICHNEMFGELADEKEVTALTRKIAEARTIKSYDTYSILAQFASPGILVRMIKPLKEKAEETQSHKVAVKLDKAFRQILSGLLKNDQLTEKDLLLFSYALYDQATGIFGDSKHKKEIVKAPSHLDRPDSFLITREPGRTGPAPATNRSTNDYLIQDFGLQILLSSLKNGRLQTNNIEHAPMLDPFATIVVHYISSRHISVKTTALRCLIWMLKFKLPSLENRMDNVIKTLFVHLKNNSGPGAAVSENAEFVTTVYKALSSAVRDSTASKISDKHLKVLLTYAESDFREGSKQILAFNLLKAVLSRHLLTTELREIMMNLAKDSVQGEEENLRLQCRHLTFMFLTTYNPKKIKLKEFIELFTDNLEYPLEHGRVACVTVLSDLLGKMGDAFHSEYSLTFFQLFAARLSDESSVVRHKAAESITVLLSKADADLLENVFKWTQLWLLDDVVAIKRIGFQTASLLVQVEKIKFLPRLKPVLVALTKVVQMSENVSTDESDMLEYDHLLINALGLLANIIDHCGKELWTRTVAVKKLVGVFDAVRDLLLHEHEWVRIRSLEVYWRVFQHQIPYDLSTNVLFREETPKKLAALTGALIHQLKSYSEREDYYEIWSKCILYVLQAVAYLPQQENVALGVEDEEEVKKEEADDDLETVKVDRLVSLPFAVRGVCREAIYEALYDPRKTAKRTRVVTWIGALCNLFDKETFIQFLPCILQVLYRCSNEPSAQKDETLKHLTEEMTNTVESHVGRECYSDAMRDVMIQFSKKRINRKRQQAVEPILNPEKVARKKIKKQQTKKVMRKRKQVDVEVGRLVKKSRPR